MNTLVGPVALALMNFAYIFLKAWQQRNVAFLHYGWALVTNVFLVLTEVYVVGNIAVAVMDGWRSVIVTVIAMSIGGGSGCVLSMYLHSRYVSNAG